MFICGIHVINEHAIHINFFICFPWLNAYHPYHCDEYPLKGNSNIISFYFNLSSKFIVPNGPCCRVRATQLHSKFLKHKPHTFKLETLECSTSNKTHYLLIHRVLKSSRPSGIPSYTGIILYMHLAHERSRNIVTSSPIGCAHFSAAKVK